MPTPNFGGLNQNAQISDVIDYIFRLERQLNYMLSNLDTRNVNRLDAKIITTGTLDANLVTVRSDLTSGYVQIDSLGLRANNGTINTFEIDTNGNAYFRGNITSDATITGATITGALIQTATTGRRLVLSGTSLKSLNDTVQDGFTLEGANGFLRWYTAGVPTGFIGIETVPAEQFHFSHNNIGIFGTNLIELVSSNINIGQTGATLTFSYSTVSGLVVSTQPNHNHGIPTGTVLLKDGGGTVTFVESGSHSHTFV